MFYADTFIDTVQNGKHEFIKNYIHNKPLATSWTNFVETQSTFCHAAAKTVDTTMKQLIDPLSAYWAQHLMDAWMKPALSALKH